MTKLNENENNKLTSFFKDVDICHLSTTIVCVIHLRVPAASCYLFCLFGCPDDIELKTLSRRVCLQERTIFVT
jgi:hypothetical protein